jgi:hypothetical protein
VLVVDRTQRDANGYLTTLPAEYFADSYALVVGSYRTGTAGDVLVPRELLGTIRIRSQSSQPTFIGVGPAAAVDAYLAGVQREVTARFDGTPSHIHAYPGGAPTSPPTAQSFWAARAVGPGTRTLTWTPRDGEWRVVVMNPNGSAGVFTELTVGARFPHLLWVAIGLIVGGAALLVAVRAGIRRAD